jgi:EmrB/QacA subfamily drug resistance transporter
MADQHGGTLTDEHLLDERAAGPDTGRPAGDGRPAGARPVPPETPPPATATTAEPAAGKSWLAPLGVLIVGMFMSVLDTSIVNVAMPVIQNDLGITASSGQWVSTAYSLTEGVMVPISAWLGYRFGGKNVYLACMAGFTIASTLCGLAPGLVPLIVFRILQGIPGGVIPVTCLVMLRRMVPPQRLGAAMGLYGLGIIVAPAAGPTLGGILAEYVNWRFIFFVNVPIGVLGVIAAAIVLEATPAKRDRPLDILGFGAIAGGLFAMLLALEEGSDWGWTSYPVLILFAVASNLLILFVIIERQVASPLINLKIFRTGQFVLSLVLISMISVGLFAVMFYVPQFLQGPARGLSPVDTGLALIPQALVLMVLMPLTGVLYDKIGSRWLAAAGLGITGVGMLMLSRITPEMPLGTLVTSMCVLAGGIGLCMMPIMTGGLASVPTEAAESAGSFNTLVQRVSQALGLGILTAMLGSNMAQGMADRSALLGQYAATDPRVLQMQEQGPAGMLQLWQATVTAAQTSAYSGVFTLTGAICLLAVIPALFLPSGKPTGDAPVVAH